mmetsp:Transcript_21396/g.82952  ORF Transcript_21396/g.82952 Transcript_21396/m.82952 type:complete len:753 (-) Transcript_21396:250-2508(-)
MLERVQAMQITDEDLHRDQQCRAGDADAQHARGHLRSRTAQHLPGAHARQHERTGQARGQQHMGEAVGERGVEDDPGPALDVEHAIHDLVPGGRLHPRVEHQDPERAHRGAEGDEEGREAVHPLADPPVTEEHDAEEARFQEEGGQHLVAQQWAGDVAGALHEARPVGAELEAHRHATDHAQREGQRKHLGPEPVRGQPARVLRAAPAPAEEHQQPAQRDGDRREQDVEGDVGRELRTCQEERVHRIDRVGFGCEARPESHSCDAHQVRRAGRTERHPRDGDDGLPRLGKTFLLRDGAGFGSHLIDIGRVVDVHRVDAPGQGQAARDAQVRRQAQHRRFGALARDAQTGVARTRVADDGARMHQRDGMAHGAAHGVRGTRAGRCARARHAHQLLVLWVGFHLGDQAAHHVDRLDRVAARGGFGGQHDGVGAVVDGRGHVGGLGTRGHRARHHRLEHLRGHDHRPPEPAAGAHDALLNAGHALGRQLDAQVAARHHHGIGALCDGLELFDRRRFLELGHDGRAAADQRPRLGHVFGPLHERQRDPVRTEVERQGQVAPVLCGQCADGQQHAGHVDALAIGQLAADHHAGIGEVRAAAFDDQPQLAIVEQQFGARRQGREDFRVRQADAARVTRRIAEFEPERLRFGQRDRALGERAHTQLRALQVGQDADRTADLTLELAQDREALTMRRRVAMAEVQAKDIDTSGEQPVDRVLVGTGRAEGGDDLGVAVTAHAGALTRFRHTGPTWPRAAAA